MPQPSHKTEELAARKQNPQSKDAMYCLALAYRHGDGVEADLSMATELYRQSGDLGHPQAEVVSCRLQITKMSI